MSQKRKAGILTFHCVDNYGAVLQCLALQEGLKAHFDEVEVIDYRPEYLLRDYRAINTYSLKSILMSLYSLPEFLKKKRGFRDFKKQYLNTSKKIYPTASEIKDIDSDFIFVGSDQIWNSKITGGYDPAFFGKFEGSESKKIVSYAASLGQYQLSDGERKAFLSLLENVDCISVREEEGVKLISENTGKIPSLVIDPTLLIEEDFWNRMAEKREECGKYVLIYNLTNAPEMFKIAKKISREKGLEIIEIKGGRKGISKRKHKVIYSASPKDFVDMIANAAYVVTDSFHGTAFSVIMKKDFIVIPHKTRGGRMRTLLESLGLETRICGDADASVLHEQIDYTEVNKKLSELRERSNDFISRSIEE